MVNSEDIYRIVDYRNDKKYGDKVFEFQCSLNKYKKKITQIKKWEPKT